MTTTTKHRASQACPTFFLGLCQQASQGGTSSYSQAGYELARHLGELIDDEPAAKLLQLNEALCRPASNGLVRSFNVFLRSDDAPLVIGWFRRELPRCMAMIPARRERSFLEGVHRYVIDDENDITI